MTWLKAMWPLESDLNGTYCKICPEKEVWLRGEKRLGINLDLEQKLPLSNESFYKMAVFQFIFLTYPSIFGLIDLKRNCTGTKSKVNRVSNYVCILINAWTISKAWEVLSF